MDERYLSLAEACEVLGKSERTLYRWIKSGKLKAYKPGRDYEIPVSAIREMRERSEVYPKVQAPLPLDFGVDAGPDMKRLGMQSIARMRAELLEQLADLWAVQLDRVQYDAGTIRAMDQAGFLLALNHTQDEEEIKEFLEADQLEQLELAEARFEEHGEKIHSVMRRTLGDVVEMKPYFAQRDAEREEARREISGTA